jgi:hypothetical protein
VEQQTAKKAKRSAPVEQQTAKKAKRSAPVEQRPAKKTDAAPVHALNEETFRS